MLDAKRRRTQGRQSDSITLLIQHHPKDVRSRPSVLSAGEYGRREVGEKARKPAGRGGGGATGTSPCIPRRTSRPSRTETSSICPASNLAAGDASKARSVTGPSTIGSIKYGAPAGRINRVSIVTLGPDAKEALVLWKKRLFHERIACFTFTCPAVSKTMNAGKPTVKMVRKRRGGAGFVASGRGHRECRYAAANYFNYHYMTAHLAS